MDSIEQAKALISRVETEKPKLTGIRTIAKEVGRAQDVALYLWRHGDTTAKLLALLVLDLKVTDSGLIESMVSDISRADQTDRQQLGDWLVANVIMYKSSLKSSTSMWISDSDIEKRRIFWSVQARSVKSESQELNQKLLGFLEQHIEEEDEPVRWNMNWFAAQVGIADAKLRGRCIKLGESLGLYKDFPVSKGCTSPYLPIWIESVVGKKG